MSAFPPPIAPPPPPPPPPGYVPVGYVPVGHVPGGYGPVGYGAAYRRPPRPVRTLGQAAALLILLSSATSVLAWWGLMRRRDAVQRFPQTLDVQTVLQADRQASQLVDLEVLSWLVVAVVLIIWMYRLARNWDDQGRAGRSWGPGWTIGAWFLPVASYVMPFVMLQQIWKHTDPKYRANDQWRRAPSAALIWFWGIGWAVGCTVCVFMPRPADSLDLMSTLNHQVGLAALSALVLVLTAAAAATAILAVTARSELPAPPNAVSVPPTAPPPSLGAPGSFQRF